MINEVATWKENQEFILKGLLVWLNQWLELQSLGRQSMVA